MSEPTYTLTLTSTQAALIGAACDLISRLGIGQWPEFIRHMPGDLAFSGFHEARERLQPVMTDLLARHPIGPRRSDTRTSTLLVFFPPIVERENIGTSLRYSSFMGWLLKVDARIGAWHRKSTWQSPRPLTKKH